MTRPNHGSLELVSSRARTLLTRLVNSSKLLGTKGNQLSDADMKGLRTSYEDSMHKLCDYIADLEKPDFEEVE